MVFFLGKRRSREGVVGLRTPTHTLDIDNFLELGPINRLRYRQSITINNNRIIENYNTAYLRYAVLKFF